VAKLKDVKAMKAGPSKTDKHLTNHLTRESRHVRQVSRMLNETEDGIVFAHSASSAETGGVFYEQNQWRKKEKALVDAKKSFFRSPDSQDDTDSEVDSDGDSKDDSKDFWKEIDKDDSVGSTEEVPRRTDIVESSSVHFDVILFIQMSLHPMNLEDYLWPEQQNPGEAKIEHCYHSLPTARILLGILDGVEYIHRNNIVHRDLKPSNIMLSISQNAASLLDGSIKVSDCPNCRDTEWNELYITPHIGDFGLVADIQDPESAESLTSDTAAVSNPQMIMNTASTSKQATALNADDKLVVRPVRSGLSTRQAGTRFYVAPRVSKGKTVICPKVDVYSLGVIALEMIYKFSTKSERAFELDKLKDGVFPKDFEYHRMADGIKRMLCKERDQRWGCAEVRKWLKSIIETTEEAMKADGA
jgi:translation initiation factor 2-alpha kinase 3